MDQLYSMEIILHTQEIILVTQESFLLEDKVVMRSEHFSSLWCLDEKVSQRLRRLNTWFPAGGAVCEVGEVWPCWSRYITGGGAWGFQAWHHSQLSVLPACRSRPELSGAPATMPACCPASPQGWNPEPRETFPSTRRLAPGVLSQ